MGMITMAALGYVLFTYTPLWIAIPVMLLSPIIYLLGAASLPTK